eukprot:m.287867 g.287867  ORF g.287867 m.287867 type:complete len:311 (+) comp11860_c0_seq1:972-1904(+)
MPRTVQPKRETGPGGVRLDYIEICRDDDKVLVNLHGGTVISWKQNGDEMLFLSSKAVQDNVKAIRGGIPVVFPNFGDWRPLKGVERPAHGFARISRWKLIDSGESEDGNMFIVLMLRDSKATRDLWPHKFTLNYTIILKQDALTTHLTVTNTGEDKFDFTALLHTYFLVPKISETSVSGLSHLEYLDKLKSNRRFQQAGDTVEFSENVDRIYIGAQREHLITNVASSHEYSNVDRSNTLTKKDIRLTKGNFPDTVVWNPWDEKAKAMSDLADDEYKRFVCVEAGSVASPVSLEPGEAWQGSQTMTIETHA